MIRDVVAQLVSPAMVGGAKARECDVPPRLRTPSIRGQLRFWTHALGGGELVESLWGTEAGGQRVRILVCRADSNDGHLKGADSALLIPSRKAPAPMVPPGDRVLLRLAVPEESLLPALQAVVWTWLHLGAVGRRSRRGYGSLLWVPSEGDLLTGWPPIWPSRHLGTRDALDAYLSVGLGEVERILGAPGGGNRGATPARLTTRDQVFVGKELAGKWAIDGGDASLEVALHGRNEEGRGGDLERKQLGSAAKDDRLPSPMLWRVFPLGSSGYVPVLTWFPYGYEESVSPHVARDSELFEYLNGQLGIDRSLIGRGIAEPPGDA